MDLAPITNLLLNYDREELFDKICESELFRYYQDKLDEDDYTYLLNDVTHFISTLSPKIIRE